MEMTVVDIWLQRAYWGSQMLLPLIAVAAGWIALKEAWAHRTFELLRLVEDPRVRDARAIVMKEIKPLRGQQWWADGRLHDAAATVCSAYDHLGGLMLFHDWRGRVERFFLDRWGETVVRAYPILKPFIDLRRETAPGSYENFRWLYGVASQRFRKLAVESEAAQQGTTHQR
jgi:hypothetical protein